jgi:hypothetical protein
MAQLGFGIVGTGMIAGVVCRKRLPALQASRKLSASQDANEHSWRRRAFHAPGAVSPIRNETVLFI